mgnify:CR=1 FL=1
MHITRKNSTHKRGVGLRLNDEQRLQILELGEQPLSHSLLNMELGVSETAIRSLGDPFSNKRSKCKKKNKRQIANLCMVQLTNVKIAISFL